MLINISPELRLLLSCLGGQVLSSNLDAIDWDKFVRLAVEHRVEGVAKQALLEQLPDTVPGSAMSMLDACSKLNLIRTLQQVQLMQQVGNLLDDVGIDHLFLKGALLASYYPNLPDRHAGDLDVLVRCPTQIWIAFAQLEGAGFKPIEPKMPLNKAQKAEYLLRAKDVSLYSEKHGMRVEVHTRLLKNRALWSYPADELFESADRRAIHGSVYPTLPQHVEALYVMLHGGVHGWYRLKWLYDAYLLFKDADEKAFVQAYQFAASYSLERAYLYCMQLLVTVFYMPVPEWVAKLATENHAVQARCNKTLLTVCSENKPLNEDGTPLGVFKHAWNAIRLNIFLKSGFSHVPLAFSSVCFTTRNWELFPISEHLHFFYKPLAPILIVARAMRKLKNE